VALVAAMLLQLTVDTGYAELGWPRWPLIVVPSLLLVILMTTNPHNPTPLRMKAERAEISSARVLLVVMTLANAASALRLDYLIIFTDLRDAPGRLLGNGGAIFLTNILVVGVWYWLIDRGGPGRPSADVGTWDFWFPQDGIDQLAAKWEPRFLDYFYVSCTNVVAFSPTDTMPLSRRAKAMMALRSTVAVTTVALVIARAVNVLG